MAQEVAMQQIADELAKELEDERVAKQQIADELAKEKCNEKGRVAGEKQRRTEQAKRIVQRLLHSQLAHSFDSFV
jgi:hypothetical protein